jgi:hypothetical protein
MNNNIDHIVKSIFHVETLEEVSVKQLNDLIDMYPSFNFAHYMLSRKLKKEVATDFEKETKKTALYFTNPFWLQWVLEKNDDVKNEPAHADYSSFTNQVDEANSQTRIRSSLNKGLLATDRIKVGGAFEPYYTIDYFASQGIIVSQEENPNDKFGKQLKSFAEWLKTMKRLPHQLKEPDEKTDFDSARNTMIENFAAHSIEQKEIITETMAQVLIKQGKKDRAVELYHKLSLLNPSKNAYFAGKIEQLK